MTYKNGLAWLRACKIDTPFPDSGDLPPLVSVQQCIEPHMVLLKSCVPICAQYIGLDSYRLFLDKHGKPVLWAWDNCPKILEPMPDWVNDMDLDWRCGRWHTDSPPMTISDWIMSQRV